MTATIADVGGQAGVLNAGNCIRACCGWPAILQMRRFWYRKCRIVDRLA